MKIEKLQKEYSDNPIEWMKKHNCVTTKHVVIELMNQAYNEALEDVKIIKAPNRLIIDDEYFYGEESILKLKKS